VHLSEQWLNTLVPMPQIVQIARNPCTQFPGDARIASIAGGTSTWDASNEKLCSSCWSAWKTAMALAGAVLSNPTAKKTTSLEGFSLAILTASRGETADFCCF
jgi:hypothetical protein